MREHRHRLDEEDAALAWFDAAHGQEHEAIRHSCALPKGGASFGRDRSESVGVDAVVDDDGVDAVVGLQSVAPVLAHHYQLVRLLDGLALTVDEGRGGEVVDVMHRPHHSHAGAGVPHPGGGACGDAVLGVEDVHLVGDLRQPGLEVVDRGEHPLLQGVGRRGGRNERVRRAHGSEEGPGQDWRARRCAPASLRSAIASARDRVWTTPPRALVE